MSDDDGVNSAYNRSYGYDFLSRLTSMTAPNTPSANSSFVYDRWGNLYQATGSESWNVSINTAANQIQGFTYDNDGRLTNDGGNTYSWNALGLMTNFNGSASSYWFDAFGRRVRAATPAGTFDYFYDVNGALRGVWNETNGTWKQLEIGLGSASLETYNATPPSGYSNFTYTGTSLLGSTAFRYNPGSGGIAKNYHFLPYGLEWPGEASDTTTNLKWTGHEQDSESGLYHFLFRNYAPLENRWLSPDPAGWAAADQANPQTWNRYSYAAGSPCSAVDPFGLAPPCQFNIALNNQANVGTDQVATIEQQAATIFKTETNGGLGLDFHFSGNPDFKVSLVPSNPWYTFSKNDWGVASGVGLHFAFVAIGKIQSSWAGSSPLLERAAGWTLAHELGHELANLGDLKSGRNLMSENNPDESRYIASGGTVPGGQLTGDQINKLTKRCLKKHKPPAPATGGPGGGGTAGPGGPGPAATGGGDWDPFQVLEILLENGAGASVTVSQVISPPKSQ